MCQNAALYGNGFISITSAFQAMYDSSMIMRRLAQFVRLHLSRVCVCICLASAHVKGSECSRLCASVHVKGSECVRLLMLRVPNARVCVHLSRVCVCVRLFAFVSRLCASASVSRLSRVCVRLFASVCVCSRLSRVCVRLVSRRSSCLACVCVCLWELAHFMRLTSFKEFKGGGNWLRFLLSVSRHTIPLLYI